MRMIYCLFLLLPACASHAVRCDGRLQPINLPARAAAGASAPAAASASAAAAQRASARGAAGNVPSRRVP